MTDKLKDLLEMEKRVAITGSWEDLDKYECARKANLKPLIELLIKAEEALKFYADKDITVNEIYMEGGKEAIKALAAIEAFRRG